MIEIVKYEDEYWELLCDFLRINAPRHPELRDKKVFDWELGDKRIVLSNGRIVGFANIMTQGKIKWGTKIIVDRSNDIIRKVAGGAILNDIIDDDYCAVGLTDEIIPAYEKRGMTINYDMCRMYSVFFNAKPFEHLKIKDKHARWLGLLVKAVNCIFVEKMSIPGPQVINDTHKTSQPGKTYYLYVDVSGRIIFRKSIHPKTGMCLCRICEFDGDDKLISMVVNWAKNNGCDGVVAYDSTGMSKSYWEAGMLFRRRVPVAYKKNKPETRIQMFTADLDNLW